MSGFSQLNPVPVAVGGTGDTGSAWTSYTPTVTATTGTFTSVSATGAYKTIGRTMFIRFTVTITTIGTAAGRMLVTLPSGSFAAAGAGFAGGFNNTSNLICGGTNFDDITKFSLVTAAGLFPGTTGDVINFAGILQTA